MPRRLLLRPWACGFDRRLRRIERSEAKAAKVLSKTRSELMEALDHTDKLINNGQKQLEPHEQRLNSKLQALQKQVESVERELAELRVRREDRLRPLMDRRADLQQRLALIDRQLESINTKDDQSGSMRQLHRSQTVDAVQQGDEDQPQKPMRRRSVSAMPLNDSSPPAYSP